MIKNDVYSKNYIKKKNYERQIQGMFYELEPQEDCLEEIKKQLKNDKKKE